MSSGLEQKIERARVELANWKLDEEASGGHEKVVAERRRAERKLAALEAYQAVAMAAQHVTVNSMDGSEGELFSMEVEGLEQDVRMTREQAEYLFNQLGLVLGKEGF